MRRHLLLASALVLGACTFEDATDETAEQSETARRGSQDGQDVSVPSRDYSRYDPTSVASQRRDPAWRTYAERDRQRRLQGPGAVPATSDLVLPEPQPPLTSGLDAAPAEPGAPPASTGEESFESISPDTLRAAPALPVPQDGAGPSALRVQILLDRARFSPGILDGHWGKNTEKAVYWFQHARGMNATGEVDRATWDALRRAAGPERPYVRQITLTAQDVTGFAPVPEDVYAQAELDCLCYGSPLERIAERSHSTTELLAQLNPNADLENLAAGATLWVPDVPPVIPAQVPPPQNRAAGEAGNASASSQEPAGASQPAAAGQVQRLVISKQGFYLHALDGQGNILFHFPSTLGSDYDPSPGGEHKVTLVKRNPDFHYQPKLFHDVPDTEKDAYLPPGPNSPVGLVWMQLSKPNYGIHGTAVPDTIGYTSSHGCIRLANWDALFLADRIRPGVPVEFVD